MEVPVGAAEGSGGDKWKCLLADWLTRYPGPTGTDGVLKAKEIYLESALKREKDRCDEASSHTASDSETRKT